MVLKLGYLKKLRRFWDFDMIEAFFRDMIEGKLGKEEIKTRLKKMSKDGESVDEIVAAARVMREYMIRINVNLKYGENLLDIVGTGGDSRDGKTLLNISTISAIVAAGAGCKVAKHCNRGVSSKFGSVDLLEKLGVNVNLEPEQTKRLIEDKDIGIGFMYAPLYHPAMGGNVAKARKEIGHRTIFNLIAPLINPASPQTMLVGAYDVSSARKIAYASNRLDVEKAIVFHDQQGYDEIGLVGPVQVFDVRGERVKEYEFLPSSFVHKVNGSLEVSSSEESAEICRKMFYRFYHNQLSNRERAMKEAVILNAGFGIYVNGKARFKEDGFELARKSIDEGHAGKKLERLIEAGRGE